VRIFIVLIFDFGTPFKTIPCLIFFIKFIMGRYSKHSIDFKNLVVRLYTQQKSFRKTSRVTGVPRSTICNWYHVSPVSRRNTYYKKCTPVVKNEIEQLILANPFLSSLDIIRIIKDRLNISIAASTARRQRKSLGFTRKRPSRVPTNHDLDIKRKNFAIAMADATPPQTNYVTADIIELLL
jgi:transposase